MSNPRVEFHCPADPNPLTLRPVGYRDKILAWDDLPAWRSALRAAGRRLVVTNGCFDILHVGHVTYLETARQLGDALLVGLNSDASVRALKGPGRPVNPQDDRAAVVAALECVSGVCIFQEVDACRFLAYAEPDVYVKGGDYTLDTLNPAERRIVEALGGRIVVLPLVPGRSTTALLQRLGQADTL
jgi:rfaE bifunctional protein nucleotidyltransferase chain/domain